MLKFIVLFFAAFAVFSPLFLIGIRKYTGRRAKRALGANIASFFAFLVLASVVGIGGSASAAGTPEAAAAAGGIAEGLKYVGPGRGPERHRRRHRRGLLRVCRPGRHLRERQGLR